MDTQRCRVCEQVKPLNEFYMRTRDNRPFLRCKSCHNRIAETTRDPVQTRQRKRRYDRSRPEAMRVKYEKYRDKYPEKYIAGMRFRYAVKMGRLIRPDKCSRCDSAGSIQGHHDDYSKPLEVEWLCPKCHVRLHRESALTEQQEPAAIDPPEIVVLVDGVALSTPQKEKLRHLILAALIESQEEPRTLTEQQEQG